MSTQTVLDKLNALQEDHDNLVSEFKKGARKGADRRAPDVRHEIKRSFEIGGNLRREWEDPTLGFKSFSHFASELRNNTLNGSLESFTAGLSDRIGKSYRAGEKAATGLQAGVLSDGGALVPPQFSANILERVYQSVDLLGMTDQYTVSGNSMVFPALDETSRANGSRAGGVRGYWLDEAGQITSSRPKFRNIQLTLQKAAVLAYSTEELLSDSGVALEQYLTRKSADEIAFMIGDAIINGNGVGKPLGILNSPSLVTVSKESGPQTADTIVFANIVKMWSRMRTSSLSNAVWLINQDCWPQLLSMYVTTGTTGQPVYLPPGGLSGSPYGTLMGRPVLPTEWSATIGDLGDIILADMSQYLTVSKGTIESAVSMHLRFDYAEQCFRFIMRIAGQPWENSAVTPFKGANTQSAFVTLEAR